MAHETLTPAQIERLEMLAEECAEVIQSVTKVLRHGYESYHPFVENSPSNRNQLEGEIIDVMSVVKEMSARVELHSIYPKDLKHPALDARWSKKLRFTHHQ